MELIEHGQILQESQVLTIDKLQPAGICKQLDSVASCVHMVVNELSHFSDIVLYLLMLLLVTEISIQGNELGCCFEKIKMTVLFLFN